MIQRIQSLFLLAAATFSGISFKTPLSEFILKNGDLVKLYSHGLYDVTNHTTFHLNTLVLAVLIITTTLINLIVIFIYKRRVLQMRLCVYNILLTIAILGVHLYFHFMLKKNLDIASSQFTLSAIFPIINIILIFQAFRAIKRDDLLLKSYDRLR